MLNENTGKFLKEKRKNQVKEDNREREKRTEWLNGKAKQIKERDCAGKGRKS